MEKISGVVYKRCAIIRKHEHEVRFPYIRITREDLSHIFKDKGSLERFRSKYISPIVDKIGSVIEKYESDKEKGLKAKIRDSFVEEDLKFGGVICGLYSTLGLIDNIEDCRNGKCHIPINNYYRFLTDLIFECDRYLFDEEHPIKRLKNFLDNCRYDQPKYVVCKFDSDEFYDILKSTLEKFYNALEHGIGIIGYLGEYLFAKYISDTYLSLGIMDLDDILNKYVGRYNVDVSITRERNDYVLKMDGEVLEGLVTINCKLDKLCDEICRCFSGIREKFNYGSCHSLEIYSGSKTMAYYLHIKQNNLLYEFISKEKNLFNIFFGQTQHLFWNYDIRVTMLNPETEKYADFEVKTNKCYLIRIGKEPSNPECIAYKIYDDREYNIHLKENYEIFMLDIEFYPKEFYPKTDVCMKSDFRVCVPYIDSYKMFLDDKIYGLFSYFLTTYKSETYPLWRWLSFDLTDVILTGLRWRR